MRGWQRQKEQEEIPQIDEETFRMQRQLGNLLAESQEAKFSVSAVAVKGAQKTNQGVFDRAFKPLFEAKTLGDVFVQTQRMVGSLNRLGIFSNVDVTLDKALNIPGKVDVLLHVKEKPRISAKTGTELAATEGNLVSLTSIMTNSEIEYFVGIEKCVWKRGNSGS
jgi:outer membrane protein assembly factor BamA